MNKSKEKITIKSTKHILLEKMVIGFIILALVLLSLGLIIDMNTKQFVYVIGVPSLIPIIGVIFFKTLAIKDKKHSLIVGPEGIEHNYDCSIFIPWDDVNEIDVSVVTLYQKKRSGLLLININDSEKYIKMAKNRMKRNMQFNYNQCGTPFTYSSSDLDIEYANEVLQTAFNKYKQK